jgi:hypothetical protein
MQPKILCLLDKSNGKSAVAELPSTATAIAYSRILKEVLFCNPDGGYVGKASRDGKVQEWFKRRDSGVPTGICLSNNGTLTYVKTDREPYFWRFTTEAPDASMRVLGTVGSGTYSELHRSMCLDHDKPNGLCFMNGRVYWASRDRHRISCATQESWVRVAYGNGNRGFSITGDPLVSTIDSPCGLCSDSSRMFLSDTGNNIVRELDQNLSCVTVFGIPGNPQVVDGTRVAARLSRPSDISCDDLRVVFVDEGRLLRQIDRISKSVSTIYSSRSKIGGVACSPSGVFFVEDL